jgi:hypothetical protein
MVIDAGLGREDHILISTTAIERVLRWRENPNLIDPPELKLKSMGETRVD